MWQFVGFMHPTAQGTDRKNKYAYGPLPVKRWVKSPDDKRHKMNYRTSRLVKKPARGAAREAHERTAIEYCRWLAARDGIIIGDPGKVHWGDARHVQFVSFYGERNVRVDIQIPNWDFEPIEPVEERVDLPGDGLVKWLDDLLLAA